MLEFYSSIMQLIHIVVPLISKASVYYNDLKIFPCSLEIQNLNSEKVEEYRVGISYNHIHNKRS